MRIVSLVPAATDIVCELGLAASLVGISHECEVSPSGRDAARLTRSVIATETLSSAEIDVAVTAQAASGGPMYHIDVDQLLALEPDLVISQSLCDVCALPADAVEHVLADAAPTVPLYSLDGTSLDGMLRSIEAIGERTGRRDIARRIVGDLRARLDRVAFAVADREPQRVVCLEWLDPPYACGHWIPEMIARAGGVDLLGRAGAPSVRVTWSDIEHAHPPMVIAMPCGYDLTRALDELREISCRDEWRHAVREARVYAAAGGAYFTRPGPKLVTGVEVLASLLHSDAAAWNVPNDSVSG